MTDSNGPRPTMSRRDLLRTAGVAGAAALIPDAVDAVTEGSPATSSPAPVGEERSVGRSPSDMAPSLAGPMTNLTASETEILSAMVDRLIPTGELGPGALDEGVLQYIDRALSEAASGAAEGPGGARRLQPLHAGRAVHRPFYDRSGLGAHRRPGRSGDRRGRGLRGQLRIVLQPGEGPQLAGDVRRSQIRRQRGLCGVGPPRLPGCAFGREPGGSEAPRSRPVGPGTAVRIRL